MKTVSIRDFQLKASEYLNDLPITLTRYNLPIAVVTAVEGSKVSNVIQEVVTDKNYQQYLDEIKKLIGNNPHAESKDRERLEKVVGLVQEYEKKFDKSIEEQNKVVDKFNMNPVTVRWCQRHFEKDKEYECKLIAYEDINGNVMEKLWTCPKCLELLEVKVKTTGGKLLYE